MKKSEDTPVEKCSKARRVPTKTGFKQRVTLPSSQQRKGYASVSFEWTPLLRTGGSDWGASNDMKRRLPRRSRLEEISDYPVLSRTVNRILLIAGRASFHRLG